MALLSPRSFGHSLFHLEAWCLDLRSKLLPYFAQRHAASTEDQVVQFLALLRLHIDAGAYVFRDEYIIEYGDFRQTSRPVAVLENCRGGVPSGCQYHMRRMTGSKPVSLGNGDGIAV